MVMRASPHRQRPPGIYTYPVNAFPGEKVLPHCPPLLVVSPSQNSLIPFSGLFLWGLSTLLTVSLAPAPTSSSALPWAKPLKGPQVSMPSLYSLCTHGANPRQPPPPRGHPETTNMWAAAEQRDVFTFHPELQLDLQQKQKYCNVYFFPRNDNYSTPNIFQTSTTKMEKAFQKIIN